MTSLYVRDRVTGRIHCIGTDVHDCLMVDERGIVQYHNLQNGDGTMIGYSPDQGGYEFVKTDEYGYAEETMNIGTTTKDEEYMTICRHLHSFLMRLSEKECYEEASVLLSVEVAIKELLSKYNTMNASYQEVLKKYLEITLKKEKWDDEE